MGTREKITVDGVEYVRADSVKQSAEQVDGMDYVIVRTYSAGVFAGYLKSRKDKEVVLCKARRLWYWSGAASLSQLSIDGVSNPDTCKFPAELETVTLTEAIEVIPATEKARAAIAGVEIWKA